MPKEEITFEKITEVYRREGKQKRLTKIDPMFYEQLIDYLARLRKEIEDKESTKTLMLKDEISKVIKKTGQIYGYRERKIVLSALSRARGSKPDEKILTTLEKSLYEELVNVLKKYRVKILGNEFSQEIRDRVEKDSEKNLREKMEKSERAEGEREKVRGKSNGYAIIRVLEDIPSFVGLDREYRLKKEDIVSLPKSFAKVLCDRGKAVIIKK